MFPLKYKQLIRGCQAHIDAGLGGAADYVANYVNLYAPFDSKIETYFGPQGGNWLRLTRSNGDKLEFAHLSEYKATGDCKQGDLIAVTGNTGQITTGPHLHVQIFVGGQRVDPEKYFMTKFNFTFVGKENDTEFDAAFEFAKNKIEAFGGGQLTLSLTRKIFRNIDAVNTVFTSDKLKAYYMTEPFDVSDSHSAVVFYDTTMMTKWAWTATIDKLPLIPFISIPRPFGSLNDGFLFEVGHALIKYYNEHRGSNPSISNEDNYSGGEQFVQKKVKALMPYLSVFENPAPIDMKFLLRQVPGSKEVWIIRNGKRIHVGNSKGLLSIADFSDITPISQIELDSIPDSGGDLSWVDRE